MRQSDPGNLRNLPVISETSAGGLCIRVSNGEPEVAVIARRHRSGKKEWCLPKGHVEPNETIAEAACREIAEEAGVNGKIIQHLCTIDYWFSGSRTRVHKTVHHYLLTYTDGAITVENDPDHEAEEAAWVKLREVQEILEFPNEKRVIQVALDLLFPGP